jgi:hypothetical protein
MPSRQVLRYIRNKDSNRTTYKQRERIIQRDLTKYLNGLDVVFYNDWAAGAYLTDGQNTSRRAMASNAGWVDTFIAEPRHGFHGLFIELKKEGVVTHRRDGKLRKDPQIYKENAFLERMRAKGFKAEFAIGMDEARRLIDEYLGVPFQVMLDEVF